MSNIYNKYRLYVIRVTLEDIWRILVANCRIAQTVKTIKNDGKIIKDPIHIE